MLLLQVYTADVDTILEAAHVAEIAGPGVRAGKWAWISGYIGSTG